MVSRLQQMDQSFDDAALRAESESQSGQDADADAATQIDDGVRPKLSDLGSVSCFSSDFADQESTGCDGLKSRRHG